MATLPDEEIPFSPIDVMRDTAATAPTPVDVPEYGLGTDHQKVANINPVSGPAPTRLTLAEWRGLEAEVEKPLLARIADLEADVARLEAELERARS